MTSRAIGIYHELPGGKIAYSYGVSNYGKTIHYRFYLDEKEYTCPVEVFDTWKPRRDLKDWPGSTDPVLPYVFDLFYDCKRVSHLVRYLQVEATAEDEKHIRELMQTHNISLPLSAER